MTCEVQNIYLKNSDLCIAFLNLCKHICKPRGITGLVSNERYFMTLLKSKVEFWLVTSRITKEIGISVRPKAIAQVTGRTEARVRASVIIENFPFPQVSIQIFPWFCAFLYIFSTFYTNCKFTYIFQLAEFMLGQTWDITEPVSPFSKAIF